MKSYEASIIMSRIVLKNACTIFQTYMYLKQVKITKAVKQIITLGRKSSHPDS